MLVAIVQLLHLSILWGFFYFPFSENDTLLLLHLLAVPSMVAHWALNNDLCALTLLEAALTGKPRGETFFDRVFGTIYRFPRWAQRGPVPHMVAALLWLQSFRRVLQRRSLTSVLYTLRHDGQRGPASG